MKPPEMTSPVSLTTVALCPLRKRGNCLPESGTRLHFMLSAQAGGDDRSATRSQAFWEVMLKPVCKTLIALHVCPFASRPPNSSICFGAAGSTAVACRHNPGGMSPFVVSCIHCCVSEEPIIFHIQYNVGYFDTYEYQI